MAGDIPRGSLPRAEPKDFMCVEDVPGYIHVLVGWRGKCKLDGPGAEKLHRFVLDAVRGTKEPEVLLDLENVAYMNSQAVGIIAGRLLRAIRESGGELHIYKPDPWVRQLIETLRLDQVLPVLEELPEPA